MNSEFVPLVLVACCLAVSWTDLQSRRIPNRILLFAFFAVAAHQLSYFGARQLIVSLLSGLVPLLMFCLLSLRWPEAVGMGDVKLLALLAFALGFAAFTAILLLASLFALFFVLCLRLGKRKTPAGPIPFAPFVTLGLLLHVCLQ